MNMIACTADCIYQKEGYCCLDRITALSDTAFDGCHYYQKEQHSGVTSPETENPSAHMQQ